MRRRRTRRSWKRSRWRGSMSTEIASAGAGRRSPGDHLIRLEHRLQQRVPGQVLGDPPDDGAGGKARYRRAVESDHRDRVAGGELTGDGGGRQTARIITFDEVQRLGHQKTRKRRAARTRSVIASRVTGTTERPSAFQSRSSGMEPDSTWNG